MKNQNETPIEEVGGTMLKVRIGAQLHGELVKRHEATGRPKTTELVRLAMAGLYQQQTLGERAENGFELTVEYALHGAAGVIDHLIRKLDVDPKELRGHIARAEYGKRFDALPADRQTEILYGIKP